MEIHFLALAITWATGPEVISECNLPMLAWRRRVHCLCLLYNLYSGQGPPSPSELLPATVQARTEIVLRSSHAFNFPFVSSSRHLSSFLCFFYPSLEHYSGLCHISEPYYFFFQIFSSLSTKWISFLQIFNFQS